MIPFSSLTPASALNVRCHRGDLGLPQVSGLLHLLTPAKAAGAQGAAGPSIARRAHIHRQHCHHQPCAGRDAQLSGFFSHVPCFLQGQGSCLDTSSEQTLVCQLPVKTYAVSPSHKKDLIKDKDNKWAEERLKLRDIETGFIQQMAIIALSLHLLVVTSLMVINMLLSAYRLPLDHTNTISSYNRWHICLISSKTREYSAESVLG